MLWFRKASGRVIGPKMCSGGFKRYYLNGLLYFLLFWPFPNIATILICPSAPYATKEKERNRRATIRKMLTYMFIMRAYQFWHKYTEMTDIWWKAAYHVLVNVDCHNAQESLVMHVTSVYFSKHLSHAYSMLGSLLQALFLAVNKISQVLELARLLEMSSEEITRAMW